MGEALGKLYVAKYFPPEAKAKAVELVNNLLKAYDADIRTLAWMTPASPSTARSCKASKCSATAGSAA
jgi:putative endopeptidase